MTTSASGPLGRTGGRRQRQAASYSMLISVGFCGTDLYVPDMSQVHIGGHILRHEVVGRIRRSAVMSRCTQRKKQSSFTAESA
jgi:hypothetical protein